MEKQNRQESASKAPYPSWGKEYRSRYMKDYYQHHQEERKAACRRYYQAHKEERFSYFKRYRQKNLLKLREYRRLYMRRYRQRLKLTKPPLTHSD